MDGVNLMIAATLAVSRILEMVAALSVDEALALHGLVTQLAAGDGGGPRTWVALRTV